MRKLIRAADIILAVISVFIFTVMSVCGYFLPEKIAFYDGTTSAELFGVLHVERADTYDAVSVSTMGSSAGKADVSLFGIIPVGSLQAEMKTRKYVTVGGDIIGIRLYTEGLLVVGIDDVATKDGNRSPGSECGIEIGDIITEVNAETVQSSSEFAGLIAGCEGEPVQITVKRNEEEHTLSLQPVYSETEDKYRCGLWLRDSTAGIGTLTFSDAESGMLAALGHAICDSETQAVLPVGNGDVLGAVVTGCTPGEKGATGQIKGSFTDQILGKLLENNEFGIYGTYSSEEILGGELYPVASQTEIETGAAQILSTIDGEGKQFYDIEIEKITYSSEKASRSLVIQVTDPELLQTTGGIIQGMSGSPIIQNGMLVGAVTHVFLNDPTRGYGVFAETMVSEAERIRESVS